VDQAAFAAGRREILFIPDRRNIKQLQAASWQNRVTFGHGGTREIPGFGKMKKRKMR
jgi:hypothetical protein